MQRFEKLMSPGMIGMMKVRNRIVKPAVQTNYASLDGIVTRDLIDHYVARSRGGVGLVIIESTFVHPSGKHNRRQLGIHIDNYIVGLADLAEAVKTAVINKRAGGMGVISGRKAFQRPMTDGVNLLNAIQDIYLSPEVTVA